MVSNGTDYVDVFIVAILWGCTNPFLRKGAVEEDEKARILAQQLLQQQEQQQKEHQQFVSVDENCNGAIRVNENYDLLEKQESGTKHMIVNKKESTLTYQSTSTIDEYSEENKIEKEASMLFAESTDYEYELYQEHVSPYNTTSEQNGKTPPTSFIKGICLKLCSNYCNCPNKPLLMLSKFNPKFIFHSFISSIIKELKKFTKPKIAIPFLLNQCSAVFYYRIIATSDLTNVAYCQAMSMAIEGVIGYWLGERMSDPVRGFCGAAIVTLGVGICLLSKDIENFFCHGSDNGYYGDGNRLLQYDFRSIEELWQGNSDESNNTLFQVSPFVCVYAFCGIIHWAFALNQVS